MSRFASRVLLFDLLSDHSPEETSESPVLQYYTKKELMASIQQELEALLNTRCTMSWQDYESADNLEFGVPSFYGLLDRAMSLRSGVKGTDAVNFLLKKAIERFESRVTNVMVEVVKSDQFAGYTVNVSGLVMCGDVQEKVFFPVQMKTEVQNIVAQEDKVYDRHESTLKWPADKAGNPVVKL